MDVSLGSCSWLSTTGHHQLPHAILTPDAFWCSDDEGKLLDSVAVDIFRYMLVALVANKQNLVKSDIKAFF